MVLTSPALSLMLSVKATESFWITGMINDLIKATCILYLILNFLVFIEPDHRFYIQPGYFDKGAPVASCGQLYLNSSAGGVLSSFNVALPNQDKA
jgi:hypothetical protein